MKLALPTLSFFGFLTLSSAQTSNQRLSFTRAGNQPLTQSSTAAAQDLVELSTVLFYVPFNQNGSDQIAMAQQIDTQSTETTPQAASSDQNVSTTGLNIVPIPLPGDVAGNTTDSGADQSTGFVDQGTNSTTGANQSTSVDQGTNNTTIDSGDSSIPSTSSDTNSTNVEGSNSTDTGTATTNSTTIETTGQSVSDESSTGSDNNSTTQSDSGPVVSGLSGSVTNGTIDAQSGAVDTGAITAITGTSDSNGISVSPIPSAEPFSSSSGFNSNNNGGNQVTATVSTGNGNGNQQGSAYNPYYPYINPNGFAGNSASNAGVSFAVLVAMAVVSAL